MKWSLMVIMFLLLAVPSLAAPPFQVNSPLITEGLTVVYPIVQYYSRNSNHSLSFDVVNNSNGIRLNSSFATCNFFIVGNQGNILMNGLLEYDSSLGYWFKEINATVSSNKDTYPYYVHCTHNTGGFGGFVSSAIVITENGFEPADDIFKIFIWVLFIITVMGLLVTLLLTLVRFATLDQNVFDVITSWGFVVLNLVVLYLAENFLITTFVEDLCSFFVTATLYTNVALPLTALVVTMIVKSFQKKQPIGVNDLYGRRWGV